MSYVSSIEYFILYDGALPLKIAPKKMALNPFCDETLHILIDNNG